ncbi:hypothetical protein ABGB12_12930 [Actinocorallia sp. B10E7]|uniref:hypothetical protein n=1 Tax=Actinocorallia sp. B10E7 TaxID=3153558 RepID=UPI00325D74AC
MDDRELLGLLAEEAPVPRPGLADEVVAQARRARTRRRWKTAAGGLALAAAVTVAIPFVLYRQDASTMDSAAQRPAPASAPLEDQDRPDLMEEKAAGQSQAEDSSRPDAAVYEAAIDAFLETKTGVAQRSRPLRILDRICPLRGECADRPLDRDLKRDLAARMPSVRFVQDTAALNLLEPLRLGEARIEGEKARVPVSGELLRLELRQGRWRVVGGP